MISPERKSVTSEVAGSSPVVPATSFQSLTSLINKRFLPCLRRCYSSCYSFRRKLLICFHLSEENDLAVVPSTLCLAKWILAEFLRIAWNPDREVIAETIANIVQLQHSLIHELDGKPLVLQTGITAREEVLLLLGHASTNRLTRAQLRDAARQKPVTLNAAITKMLAAKELRTADDGALALTRMGSVR